MATLAEITAQLAEPFAADEIGFLPKGKVEREGKTLCMALPYADPRVYEDRLNALAPGEWSTPQPVALTVGNKLICYVTVVVCGIAHTDVGEADPGENQGTEAWAQAFKRSCSQFGLGRYLYDLEKEWVPFNPQKKQIDLDKAGQRAIVQKMYQKAGIIRKSTDKAQQNGNGHKPEPHESASPAPDKPKLLTLGQLRTQAYKLGHKSQGEFELFVAAVFGKKLSQADLLESANLATLRGALVAEEQKASTRAE